MAWPFFSLVLSFCYSPLFYFMSSYNMLMAGTTPAFIYLLFLFLFFFYFILREYLKTMSFTLDRVFSRMVD